jgi:hypothetical protein
MADEIDPRICKLLEQQRRKFDVKLERALEEQKKASERAFEEQKSASESALEEQKRALEERKKT